MKAVILIPDFYLQKVLKTIKHPQAVTSYMKVKVQKRLYENCPISQLIHLSCIEKWCHFLTSRYPTGKLENKCTALCISLSTAQLK